MSDYPMLISNKLHSFRNFVGQIYTFYFSFNKKTEILLATFKTNSLFFLRNISIFYLIFVTFAYWQTL